MTRTLHYRIAERRICWPNPTNECLAGACGRCNQFSFRSLVLIESHARMSETALEAYAHGLENEFFATETRASLTDLKQYADDVGTLALKEMADGMPGGTHGKSRAVILAWVVLHNPDVLDESFRLSRRKTWRIDELTDGGDR